MFTNQEMESVASHLFACIAQLRLVSRELRQTFIQDGKPPCVAMLDILNECDRKAILASAALDRINTTAAYAENP
jgi:hypothetical protein